MTDKIQKAIDRLKLFEPADGYFLAFSGGKDSQTIYHLAKEAGVKFEAHFHMTSIDPPEVISFVKNHYVRQKGYATGVCAMAEVLQRLSAGV